MRKSMIVDNDGGLRDAARDLVHALGGVVLDDLRSANAFLQRQAYHEARKRLTPTEKDALTARRDELRPLLAAVGMTEAMDASGPCDDLLILGAKFIAVGKRMCMAIPWAANVRPKRIFLLGGNRTVEPGELDLVRALPNSDHLETTCGWPGTLPQKEHQLMEGMWDIAETPVRVRDIPWVTVAHPAENAGTRETVSLWKDRYGRGGRVAIVSSQPWGWYQLRVAEAVLHKDYDTDVLATAATDTVDSPLDAVSAIEAFAKEIWELNLRQP